MDDGRHPRREGALGAHVPHVIDTALLASAVALAVTIRQYPGTSAWLTAKVAGLVAYIVLGTIALKRRKSRRVRIAAFYGALAVFVYIVGVAATRDPFLRLID